MAKPKFEPRHSNIGGFALILIGYSVLWKQLRYGVNLINTK